jgi:adenylylsulfate kinase
MYSKVLICGLSGSGKTTFAKFLIEQYLKNNLQYYWLNGDKVREDNNDWDFSMDGRLRQTVRMCNLANSVKDRDVIIDYVCPLEEYRYIISPTFTVFLDTNTDTKHENTKKIFEPPISPNLVIKDKDAIELSAKDLYDYLIKLH